jgi:hypothetical protein
MKVILRKVKIYGFDPNIFRVFDNAGKETKRYSVALHISDEDRDLIDNYLFDKVSDNQDGEHVFYGKAKHPIPIFDAEKNRITIPINKVFIADVSILIDEFKPDDEDEPIRYSKCLGIHYISDIENEKPKIQQRNYESFDDIFADESEGAEPDTFSAITKKEAEPIIQETEQGLTPPGTFEPTEFTDDLPF